ncbi:MAG: D-alanyl-D-alanine carboxypeptidase [Desulfobacterales bacterium]|nr:D-alanyl-D-alanine carboxypeptidase [Desulfobacterales bacterium]
MLHRLRTRLPLILFIGFIGLLVCVPALAGPPSPTKGLGPRDALLLTDPDGQVLAAHNPDRTLVPASTLKVVTALAARHYLGADFRFHTDFFLAPDGRLLVKGYGDPLLVSEVLADIARELGRRIQTPITAILLDDRYFSQPLVIPGVSTSTNPYDAPNGALSVNFNTVNFKTRQGRIVSAEPQTPLLPMAMKRIRASGQARGRIVLSHHGHEAVLYAGEMIRFFLREAGVDVQGPVGLAPESIADKRLVYRHTSPISLDELVSRLMAYSNNFMANQLLVATGAHVYGAPGDLTKGAQALTSYLTDVLGVGDARIVEGSGISRANRISARSLMIALARFEPHRHLMTEEAGIFFKTGTLKGIRTRVGYIENDDGRPHRFVLLLNTPGKRPEPVVRRLRAIVPHE